MAAERLPPIEDEGLCLGNEALREALFGLRESHDLLKQSNLHLQHLLDALETLLRIEESEDPFEVVFASLRQVFVFSRVFMLAENENDPSSDIECIVSEEPAFLGTRWPVFSLFRKIMSGKVTVTFSGLDIPEWKVAVDLGLDIDRPVLYVPVRVRDRHGILLMIRDVGDACFDRTDVSIARRFSVVVSHALATRYASRDAAESRRLRELGEQLQRSEQVARRNADLLEQIVNALPVGVAVQSSGGELMVINSFAERAFGDHGRSLPAPPVARHSSVPGASDRQTFEYEAEVDGEPRVMLINSSPTRILDERLQITTAMDITVLKRSEAELHHRAYHDQLTGLPNRDFIKETVERGLAEGTCDRHFALAFIDIDNFKHINDFYSHALGDQLLLAFAGRIRALIGEGDLLARISGDEFLLMIGSAASQAEVERLIDGIVEEVRKPFLLEGHEVFSSASIGVSVYPQHGHDYESLRRSADNAMYRAKSDLKGSVAYFDDTMRNALTARMEVEQKLRAAIRGRHFRAAYQAKNDVARGAVVGFEALVRWVEPSGEVHMPGSFIGMAGELGLLGHITGFVLEDIVADLPRLKARFGDDVSVSLNVAANQINSADFTRKLLGQIRRAGIGRNLIVELTEEALVSVQSLQQALPELREMGVRISIDDFGTGFSSLSVIADVDADEIKVDRAFITDIHQRPRSQDVLKAIESVCIALDIAMVAEGVETAEEIEYLVGRTSIRVLQGFFFGKPAFVDEILTRDFGGDRCAHVFSGFAPHRLREAIAPIEGRRARKANGAK